VSLTPPVIAIPEDAGSEWWKENGKSVQWRAVECDNPECDSVQQARNDLDVRAEARARGWLVCDEPVYALCPNCR
jgi:hypothetical protein